MNKEDFNKKKEDIDKKKENYSIFIAAIIGFIIVCFCYLNSLWGIWDYFIGYISVF